MYNLLNMADNERVMCVHCSCGSDNLMDYKCITSLVSKLLEAIEPEATV